jgi:fructose-1-phosphate kinase PfkB-like protein
LAVSGKDNQDGFQQLFSELGIANRFQVVQGRTRINVKLTEKDGEVTDFNFSGFEVTPADWERFVNDSLSWLGSSTWCASAAVCRQALARKPSLTGWFACAASARALSLTAAAKRWLPV